MRRSATDRGPRLLLRAQLPWSRQGDRLKLDSQVGERMFYHSDVWTDEELERTRRSLAMTSSNSSAGGVRVADVIQLIEAVQQGRRLHRALVELLNNTTIPAANAHLRHVMAAIASAVADATALGGSNRIRGAD